VTIGSVGLGMVSDQGVPRVKGFVVDTRGENNPLRGNESLLKKVGRFNIYINLFCALIW